MAAVINTWQDIVARTWEDEEFKQRLIDEPDAVLAENGMNLPQGVHAVIVENDPNRIHFVLPRPVEEHLGDTAGTPDADLMMEYNAAFS